MQHWCLASRGSRCDRIFPWIFMLITGGKLTSVNTHVHIFPDFVIVFYPVLRRMSVQIIKYDVIFIKQVFAAIRSWLQRMLKIKKNKTFFGLKWITVKWRACRTALLFFFSIALEHFVFVSTRQNQNNTTGLNGLDIWERAQSECKWGTLI